jgi:hypothetical protein
MEPQRFAVAAAIPAPPENVYAILADYREGHPSILPRPPFVALDVESGGTGAGTVINVRMRVMGRLQSFRSVVTEPEPGRVLVETNDTGYITTFTVDSRAGGRHASVTIATEFPRLRGVRGNMERWFVTRLLRPVYQKELEKLAAVALHRVA